MNNYIELTLLGILVVLIYKKPEYLKNVHSNKIYIILLIFLNAYISKKFGITSGIIMALITIVLLDNNEYFTDISKEDFTNNKDVKVWRPANFTQPCQVENDRILKRRSETSTLRATL